MIGKTIVDKIWDAHTIKQLSDGRTLLRIDRHLIHDGSSRQAFDGLRKMQRHVRASNLNFTVIDHIVSTLPGRTGESHPPGVERIHALRDNARQFGLELYDVDSPLQGIVHVISPEQGITLPGCTLVCGDSHTATNGGLGALAWGIGTTEVMYVPAAQALLLRKPKQLRIVFSGKVQKGVYAKDLILHLIGREGVSAGIGYAVEYAGEAIACASVEERMTICNMSVEFGARIGLVAPDNKVFDYLHGRKFAPKGAGWDSAVKAWRDLPSDADARFDHQIEIDCSGLAPQVTWGNSPQDLISIDRPIPEPSSFAEPKRREAAVRALDYMGLTPGQTLEGVPIDYAFIGSCTNSRLSDLEAAAAVACGRKVKPGITALVVPGSMAVKAAAEAKGLDRVFTEAGFSWRNSGCSMCVTSNGDIAAPGTRVISTTNRNFEHRQGPQSRSHLASPAMVAAAAVTGHITDVRKLIG
jgi:3-isopropylmalate/(R)-2-methylmalate dehydratase large subunit